MAGIMRGIACTPAELRSTRELSVACRIHAGYCYHFAHSVSVKKNHTAVIFPHHPADASKRDRLLAESFAQIGDRFIGRTEHDAFYGPIVTPRSNRWAFCSVGKTGTSSVLALLFHIEFGVANTVRLDDPEDLNSNSETHRAVDANVFRLLAQRSDLESLTDYLDNAVRIAMVRNPLDRVWSAFRYLCRSNDMAHPQFAADRLRMSALVGFDWQRHSYTGSGFERFLDYVRMSLQDPATVPRNNHWAPQWLIIRPDVFRPQVLGRLEDPATFARELSDWLGCDTTLPMPAKNVGDADTTGVPEWINTPVLRDAVVACYERDYLEFGYPI